MQDWLARCHKCAVALPSGTHLDLGTFIFHSVVRTLLVGNVFHPIRSPEMQCLFITDEQRYLLDKWWMPRMRAKQSRCRLRPICVCVPVDMQSDDVTADLFSRTFFVIVVWVVQTDTDTNTLCLYNNSSQ